MLSATIAAAFYLRVVFLMYGVRLRSAEFGGDAGSLSLPLTGGVPGVPDVTDPAEAAVAGDAPIGRVYVPAPTAVAIFVTVMVTLVFGIWPAPLVNFVHSATLLF